jgi:hypothetical protein
VSAARRQPAWLRAVNAAGRVAGRAGLQASLAPARIRRAAERRTGLSDFGPDDGWDEALARLTRDLRGSARLTPVGRIAAHGHLVALLANRLRMEADRRAHPAIGATPVAAPLFIVGLPRTGTTLLHMLLAQDPENRVPRTWEVMHPAPAEGDARRRARKTARELAWMERLAPGFRVMHPLAPELPQECIAIDSHTLQSYEFQSTHRVPDYQRWLEGRGLQAAYDHHRRFLQYLQWQRPGRHWVLKAPAHLFGLPELLAAYPDAGIVQTHRDPLQVLASLASLSTALRGAFSDAVDPAAVGREMSARWGGGVLSAMAARDSGRLPDEAFMDVGYRRIVDAPLETVRAIYARFGRELTDAAESAMRRFLAAHPKNKHGRHRYSLEAFGLDREEETARFAAYRARFGC